MQNLGSVANVTGKIVLCLKNATIAKLQEQKLQLARSGASSVNVNQKETNYDRREIWFKPFNILY